MNSVKKLVIACLSILLIPLVVYYFLINPYQTDEFSCIQNSENLSAKLFINKFLLNTLEVTFSNQIFDQKECIKKEDIIECNVIEGDRDPEKIILNLSTHQLIHQWLSYDSGKYIYDKTQVAKTEQLDSYRCQYLKE
jgi:hypothetical protein